MSSRGLTRGGAFPSCETAEGALWSPPALPRTAATAGRSFRKVPLVSAALRRSNAAMMRASKQDTLLQGPDEASGLGGLRFLHVHLTLAPQRSGADESLMHGWKCETGSRRVSFSLFSNVKSLSSPPGRTVFGVLTYNHPAGGVFVCVRCCHGDTSAPDRIWLSVSFQIYFFT